MAIIIIFLLERNKMIKKIEHYFDKLFPLNRSITGKDYQKSLNILSEIIPLKKINFATGKKVFDWQIPKEWNVNEAYIEDKKGNKVIDFKKNNLHLLGYSIGFKSKLKFKDLKKNLYYIKNMPTAIPYITSYYKERWGFCLSYNQYKKLKNEIYRVNIDTSLKKGKLTVGEYLLKGKSRKEIIISSYLCHPSMANNELSGPITLAFLYDKLKNQKLKYSIRFIINPENIGAVAYLSKFKDKLKKNVIGGYVLTCCGNKGNIHYKRTKKKNSITDIAMTEVIKNYNHKSLNYYPTGSDECRYNSIGINLPIGSFMRTNSSDYKEYHTSLDNKKIISFKKLEENVRLLIKAIKKIDNSNFYFNKFHNCDPFLSKRNIYNSISKYNFYNKVEVLNNCFFWLLSYSDGKTSDIEISKISGINLKYLSKAAKILISKKIIKKVY